MKMPDALKMTMKAPAEDQNGIRFAVLDLSNPTWVYNSFKVMGAGIRSRILYKPAFISIEQRDTPFNSSPKIGVIFSPLCGLPPGIKYNRVDSGAFGKHSEPGRIVLDRVRRNYGKSHGLVSAVSLSLL